MSVFERIMLGGSIFAVFLPKNKKNAEEYRTMKHCMLRCVCIFGCCVFLSCMSAYPHGFAVSAAADTADISAAYRTASASDSAAPAPSVQPSASLTLEVRGAPAETQKNSAFDTPWIVYAFSADGTPAADVTITASYPSAKDPLTAELSYTELSAQTDENGAARFTLAAPAIACKAEIVFSCGDISVSAPYLVHTDVRRGGTIALVDFNEDGSQASYAMASSSALLTSLMLKGFSGVGNADFSGAVLSGDTNRMYAEAKALLGSQSAFAVFGTVRYERSRQDAGTHTAVLVCDFCCIDMRTGNVAVRAHVTGTGSGASQAAAVQDARRNAIAPAIAELIYYGL